jgi:hypothetical protein
LYGATPIEDIIGYNQIVRSITEWTNPSGENTMTQQSINEGIGGYVFGRSGSLSSTAADFSGATLRAGVYGPVNVRQAYIQGIGCQNSGSGSTINFQQTMGFGTVPAGTLTIAPPIPVGVFNNDLQITTNPRKRYQVQFALGLFNQPKLIPTKFMASQLSIEITLANPSECLFGLFQGQGATPLFPSYQLTNVNLIPEILEFDASYGSF